MPLVDQVTARVLDHIRANQLVPGTRLPSTAEMARAFQVAPTTLREALSRLETTGVIDVRHGVGIFVKSDASRLMVLNPERLKDDEGRLVALVDARLLLEPTLASRAAARRSATDLTRMADLLALADSERADRAKAGQANMQFHTQIAQAAGNPVLSDILAAIVELHSTDQLIIDRLFDDPSRDHAEHTAIFKAIEAGTPDRAFKLMTQHLKDVMASVTPPTSKGR
jgi:GntR family transcriptional regulator, transcriptional repressor for pyruvate dehydrogenase complex